MYKKLLIILITGLLIPLFSVNAGDALSSKLKGRILLQVESHGEAWYVNPRTEQRHYMANGSEAYNIMRSLGVGITNTDLNNIKSNKELAKKQAGKIFLQVESHGEAYYVNFDGNIYYLKNGDEAYNIMRNLGLGITNENLQKILINNSKETKREVVGKYIRQDVGMENGPVFDNNPVIIYSDSTLSPSVLYVKNNENVSLKFINESKEPGENACIIFQNENYQNIVLCAFPGESRVIDFKPESVGSYIIYNPKGCKEGFDACQRLCFENKPVFSRMIIKNHMDDTVEEENALWVCN